MTLAPVVLAFPSAVAERPARRIQSPYPSAVGRVMLRAARARVRSWDRALGRIEEEQERALRDIVGRGAATVFGRRFDLRGARDHAAFVRRIPVGNYDTFSPFIDRMRQGREEPARSRVRSLLRQLVGQLQPGQAEVLADHRTSDRASAPRGSGHADALSRARERCRILVRVHARPLPADSDEAPRAPCS